MFLIIFHKPPDMQSYVFYGENEIDTFNILKIHVMEIKTQNNSSKIYFILYTVYVYPVVEVQIKLT